MKPSAGLIIYRRKNGKIEFLLIEMGAGIPHWTIVKGKMREGENEMATAIRVVRKKTSYKQSDLKIHTEYKRVVEVVAKEDSQVITFWMAELKNLSAQLGTPAEYDDYEWVEVEEACKILQFEHMRDLIRYYDNIIKTKCVV